VVGQGKQAIGLPCGQVGPAAQITMMR
ncbi:MAG: hypothetical protein RL375_3816, partial [Pseudomonadota bacterium]